MKFSKHPAVAATLLVAVIAFSPAFAQEPKKDKEPLPASSRAEDIVDRAVRNKNVSKSVEKASLSAATMADAIARQLAETGEFKDAKIININVHVGDNIITLGFDEGIDAEEWGMVDNQVETGAAPAAAGAKPAPAVDRKSKATRTIDFRKGNLVLLATEQDHADGTAATEPAAPQPQEASLPEPAVETTVQPPAEATKPTP